jgi:hypothetical protein
VEHSNPSPQIRPSPFLIKPESMALVGLLMMTMPTHVGWSGRDGCIWTGCPSACTIPPISACDVHPRGWPDNFPQPWTTGCKSRSSDSILHHSTGAHVTQGRTRKSAGTRSQGTKGCDILLRSALRSLPRLCSDVELDGLDLESSLIYSLRAASRIQGGGMMSNPLLVESDDQLAR